MNKKKLLTVVTLLVVLFAMTGCSVPTDENGKDILIYLSTTFNELIEGGNEGFLSVIFCYPLAQGINYVSQLTGSVFLGIAIIALALNIVIVLLTYKQNASMQKMQELQPEIQKIQMKYEGRNDEASQQRMATEMQSLYQKYGINPVGSLLVTFIQLPVLFGMYAAVRRSAAVAEGTFLGYVLATTPKEAFANGEWPLVILYVVMVITQIGSMLAPQLINEMRAKKEAAKHHKPYRKAQQQNQLMMYGMVALIAFMMINWPTALSLYYAIYSVINIIKTIVIDYVSHKNDI